MDRDEALALLDGHVHKESLRNHCLATAAILRAVAPVMGGDPDRWEIIGILHDIDFEEIEEDMDRHGGAGYAILKEAGVTEGIAEIIRRHNYMKFGDFDDPADIALTAADNISGLIIACAMVKSGKVTEVTATSVKKKFKEKAFAAGCNRDRIRKIEAYMELPEFYGLAVGALQEIRDDLGLS